jgi:uracil-DNA glycosylase family 4
VSTKPPGCAGCPSELLNSGFAFGEGDTTAPIMLVGEALGESESIEGRPFVGGTGRMLRTMLWQAGLSPHHYYLTNVVKCRPPLNRAPNELEVLNCTTRYLTKEIEHVKPRVIVPVGDTALRACLPGSPAGISVVRGHAFSGPHATVIPIVHPSFVARGNPEYWAITVSDLKRIKDHATHPHTFARPEHLNLEPTLSDVLQMSANLLDKRLPVAFDIETLGEREQTNVICIGFAWSPTEALCVPFLRRGGYPYWRNEWEERQAWAACCRIFGSDALKITQNGFTFDLPVLADLGVFFRRHTVVDTLIKHHIVATELPHSLAFLTSIYTDLPYYKGDVRKHGGMLWAPDDVLRRYNLLDCIATYIANFEIDKEMEELKIYERTR